MWVLGSVAFLIPAACITIQVLQGPRVAVRPVSGGVGASTAIAERNRRRRAGPDASWALLSIPLIGAVGWSRSCTPRSGRVDRRPTEADARDDACHEVHKGRR
jgi:hypothetical protein